MTKKVIVAGHICLDITPLFSSEKYNKTEEVFIPGKLIHMKGVDIHTGGAVANTGLAFKIFGADVKLMGKIGTDHFGQLILNILDTYQASNGMIQSTGSTTSYSVVLAPAGIDRIFLHDPGANDTFSIDDLNFNEIKDAALFHFGYPPIMKKMYEEDGKNLLTIFQEVKKSGTATSLDMAAVDPNSEAGKADWKKIIKTVLPYVDFFLPSIEELAFMIDRPRYHEWIKKAKGTDVTSILSIENDVKPLADQLIEWGAKVVMIKCGAPGLFIKTADKETLSNIGRKALEGLTNWQNKEFFEQSYQPDQILSGTGAGDTSIAAFLQAMLEGYSIEECARLASATGASCITAYDALSGLLTFDELNKKIDAGWKKNTLKAE